MSMFWILLIFAAITIFLCRILPFIFANHTLLGNTDGRFYRFLTYSTQAMLGAIVYSTAFFGRDIVSFIATFAFIDVLKLLLLGFVFFATLWTNRLLSAFLLALVIFVGFVLCFYEP
ncbi:AzlD domain-containing protein [Helicobacter marmotae]|uniref:Branched-chain amino acid ABC transporter n=1 Tax=Helicobacter marmotae TaxID=152490 RepID=A0A3D8I5G4_9HELI|nr:AzlD domain-containing protein [Helicobacter marmotae]RDU60004.1 branched-chain amino acid ABC transporter [Helicobacter marmotae]